jgi:hypothetical protein
MHTSDLDFSSFPRERSEIPCLSHLSLARAEAAVYFAFALRRRGWFPHQNTSPMDKVEAESRGITNISPECTGLLATLQVLVDQSVAYLPPPDLLVRPPFPLGPDGGVALEWISDERPVEQSFSRTTDASAVALWSSIVSEVGSSWASFRSCLSAGLLFLGPKDRLCFWPKQMNYLLQHIPVSYGSILDLFTHVVRLGIKLDIKSAFRAIGVTASDAVYLGAVLDSFWIGFDRLPFGLAVSPAIFTHTLAITLAKYRQSCPATMACLAQFVDDSALAALDDASLIRAATALIHAFMADGWWLSLAKTYLRPCTHLCYTGFIALFAEESLAVAESKAAKLTTLLRSIRLPSSLLFDDFGSSPPVATKPIPLESAMRSPGVSVFAVSSLEGLSLVSTLTRRAVVVHTEQFPPPSSDMILPRFVASDSSAELIFHAITQPVALRSSDPVIVAIPSGRIADVATLGSFPPSLPVIFLSCGEGPVARTPQPPSPFFTDIDVLPDHIAPPQRRPLPSVTT